MKRALALGLASLVVLGSLFLAGCTSYATQAVQPGLSGKKHVFIQSNQNDNNALDTQIVTALKLRGYEAESGPLTMMPDEAQVIVTYEDHWTWDFGDHLAYLQISAKDRRTGQLYASAVFQAKIRIHDWNAIRSNGDWWSTTVTE